MLLIYIKNLSHYYTRVFWSIYIQYISILKECPYKFTRAQGLYCDKDCGANWLDNEHGCQASDADAFCRMKLCRIDVYAKNYTITDASNKNGFSSAGIGTRYRREYEKYQGFDEVYFTNDIKSSHGVGNMVTNIVCDNITSKNICHKTLLISSY